MESIEAQIQTFDDELFRSLVLKAEHSPRRRINHNFHRSNEENPHRFLNVFLRGSYVTPHRHAQPPKAESFLVLDGWMAAIFFNDVGEVIQTRLLGVGPRPADLPEWAQFAPVLRGIDLAPGVWHTVAALSPQAVCYEVKPGPWDPQSDKEFAPWAPVEGAAASSEYLETLLKSGATGRSSSIKIVAGPDNASIVEELKSGFRLAAQQLTGSIEPATVYRAHVRVLESDMAADLLQR